MKGRYMAIEDYRELLWGRFLPGLLTRSIRYSPPSGGQDRTF
jgi:hypothetical protein